MSSEWFIFKGTHHIGPFTATEIEVMFKRGDIEENVLVWKEGESSWLPLLKCDAFSFLFQTEKIVVEKNHEEIPAIPNVEDEKKHIVKKLPQPLRTNLKEVENTSPLDLSDDELPPPLPMDVFQFEDNAKKSEATSSNIKLQKFQGVKNTDKSKYLLGAIAVASMGIFTWHLLNESKSDIEFKIKDLMPVYKEQLVNTAQEIAVAPKVKMALAMNGYKVYFATNLSNELDVSVRLSSINNRTLGVSTGVMYLRGKVFNHLGEFNKVYLTNGQIFSPGEFNYEVHIVEKHFLNTYFPVLSNIPYVRKLNNRYTIYGKELLFSSSPRDFEAKLKNFQSEQKEKVSRPILEAIEKLATMSSLCDQSLSKLSDVMVAAKSGKDLKGYEEFYFKNISPVLQNLIFDEKSKFGQYNLHVKDISGVLSIPISDEVKARKFIPQEKGKFILEMKSKVEAIKMKILADQNLLNDQLKNLSSL